MVFLAGYLFIFYKSMTIIESKALQILLMAKTAMKDDNLKYKNTLSPKNILDIMLTFNSIYST